VGGKKEKQRKQWWITVLKKYRKKRVSDDWQKSVLYTEIFSKNIICLEKNEELLGTGNHVCGNRKSLDLFTSNLFVANYMVGMSWPGIIV
jgi:hypothetical protein